MKIELFTDGACSGNPGPGAIGVIVKRDNNVVQRLSRYIGETTNNIAEYTAVIYALQAALIMRADNVSLFTDSELIASQLNGVYKVTSPHLLLLFDQIQHLKTGFQSFCVQHVRREYNKDADSLARKALKSEPTKMVASRKATESQMDFVAKGRGEESPSSTG